MKKILKVNPDYHGQNVLLLLQKLGKLIRKKKPVKVFTSFLPIKKIKKTTKTEARAEIILACHSPGPKNLKKGEDNQKYKGA